MAMSCIRPAAFTPVWGRSERWLRVTSANAVSATAEIHAPLTRGDLSAPLAYPAEALHDGSCHSTPHPLASAGPCTRI
jgi:hypothetical protein